MEVVKMQNWAFPFTCKTCSTEAVAHMDDVEVIVPEEAPDRFFVTCPSPSCGTAIWISEPSIPPAVSAAAHARRRVSIGGQIR